MKIDRVSRILVVLLLATGYQNDASADKNANIEREVFGKIEYRLLDNNEWRGEEDFRLTEHTNGDRTIRITNRLDETGVLRDVVMRVRKNFSPVDLYVSHWKDGIHRGTGYYWADKDGINALVKAPNGILQQTVSLPDQYSIATRPQAAFGWHLWYFDFKKGGKQPLTIYVLSKWALGVGSILGGVQVFPTELLGSETVRVGAGEFDTWHVRIGEHYELWADKSTLIAVKLVVASKNRIYELVELTENNQ